MTVHCPECGRPNPDEAYICQYCDKPLVAYIPHQIEGEQPEHIEPVNEDPQDWLENLRQKKEEDAKVLGEEFFNRFGSLNTSESSESIDQPEQTIAPAEDLDSWLNQMNPNSDSSTSDVKDQERSLPIPPEPEKSEESQTPGWLETIREKISSNQEITGPPSSESESGVDWLSKLRNQTDQSNTDEVLPGVTLPEKPNPEWLDRVESVPHIDLFPVVTPQPESVSPFTDDLPDDFGQTILPDDDLNIFPEKPFSSISDETEHPIPEALRNSLPQIEEGSLPEEYIPPEEEMLQRNEEPREKISSKDIPSWLSNILGENEAEATSMDAVQTPGMEVNDGEQVEPSPLPNWVQAMRPVEINAKERSSQEVQDRHFEEEGPLAGIRGILPGESPSLTYSAAVGYNISSEVQKPITEKVALFNEMLRDEKIEIPVPGYRRIRAAGTVRWIVMVLLISIMMYPILTGTPPVNLTNTIPIETGQLFKSINSLGSDAKVLVVIDYEPAYAGEIEMAANAVLNQLMVKSANLYLISTNPAGSALGQKLINDIDTVPQSYHQSYITGEKYHILGYLPGGQAGVQALNNSLTGTIPLDINLTKTTDIPGLSGPMPIGSFNGLLVLSDQADTLRYWIEQIKRENGKPGLWVVVTSQAAPILRPYVRSGQIEGMVAGEYGGSLYERIFQQPGLARLQWNSFQTGVLAAIILVLIGGILNYIGQLILRTRKQKSS